MDRKLKRNLAIGTTLLAAAAFSGGAVAATQDSDANVRQAFLKDVATRLNVTPEQLKAALQAAFFDQLDQAVAAGNLTKAQADAIKQRVQQTGEMPLDADEPSLFGPGKPGSLGGEGHLFFGGGGPLGVGVDAAAKYLGLTPAQLRDQLSGGKTLARVAKAHGKSTTGLKDAMIAAIRSRLDQALSAKKITSAEEQQILSDMSAHVDDFINRTPTAGKRLFGPRLRGLGPAVPAPPDADADAPLAAPAPPDAPAPLAAPAPPGIAY
jgi:transposase-like protein